MILLLTRVLYFPFSEYKNYSIASFDLNFCLLWMILTMILMLLDKVEGITVSVDTLECGSLKYGSTVTISFSWCSIGYFSMLISLSAVLPIKSDNSFLIFLPSFCQNKNGFELVPQPAFSHVNMPISSDGVPGWDISSHHQGDLSAGVMRKMEADDIGRYSPLASR